jgi:hypothetical protein
VSSWKGESGSAVLVYRGGQCSCLHAGILAIFWRHQTSVAGCLLLANSHKHNSTEKIHKLERVLRSAWLWKSEAHTSANIERDISIRVPWLLHLARPCRSTSPFRISQMCDQNASNVATPDAADPFLAGATRIGAQDGDMFVLKFCPLCTLILPLKSWVHPMWTACVGELLKMHSAPHTALDLGGHFII